MSFVRSAVGKCMRNLLTQSSVYIGEQGIMPVGKPATRGSRQEARERFLLEAAQKDPSRFAELYENNFGLKAVSPQLRRKAKG